MRAADWRALKITLVAKWHPSENFCDLPCAPPMSPWIRTPLDGTGGAWVWADEADPMTILQTHPQTLQRLGVCFTITKASDHSAGVRARQKPYSISKICIVHVVEYAAKNNHQQRKDLFHEFGVLHLYSNLDGL